MAASAGDEHTCMLLANTQLLCFGLNTNGQLGMDAVGDRGLAPGETASAVVKVPAHRVPVAVSAGIGSTCAVLDNGQALCFGDNFHGQLGLDSSSYQVGLGSGETAAAVVKVPINRTVEAVSTGGTHTCMVLDDGQALCFGWNFRGQLGLDHRVSKGKNPGETASAVVKVPANRTVISVTAGDQHSCAILDNGQALCFGHNFYGQLGLDSSTGTTGKNPGETAAAVVQVPTGRSVVSVSAGHYHTCLLLDNGKALCVGQNTHGQLGLDHDANKGEIAGDTAAAVVKVPANRTVVSVSAGGLHSCVLLDNGDALCFGSNSAGQLALDSAQGQTGTTPGSTEASIVRIPAGTTIVSLSVGGSHTCLVLADGTARCVGYIGNGRLGLDRDAEQLSTPQGPRYNVDALPGRSNGSTAASVVQVQMIPSASPSPSMTASPTTSGSASSLPSTTSSATSTPSVSRSTSPSTTSSATSTPSASGSTSPSPSIQPKDVSDLFSGGKAATAADSPASSPGAIAAIALVCLSVGAGAAILVMKHMRTFSTNKRPKAARAVPYQV